MVTQDKSRGKTPCRTYPVRWHQIKQSIKHCLTRRGCSSRYLQGHIGSQYYIQLCFSTYAGLSEVQTSCRLPS